MVDWIGKPADGPIDADRLIAAVRRAIDHSARSRPTLLHIDADPDMLEVAAAVLAGHGRIVHATSIASARAVLATQSPDIVILDLDLPDGPGSDLLPDLLRADGTAIPDGHLFGARRAARARAAGRCGADQVAALARQPRARYPTAFSLATGTTTTIRRMTRPLAILCIDDDPDIRTIAAMALGLDPAIDDPRAPRRARRRSRCCASDAVAARRHHCST